MKFLALISLLVVTVFLIACGNTEIATSTNQPKAAGSPTAKAGATPDELAVTRGIFQKECADCHGSDGSGGTKILDGKPLKVPSLREGHALKHSDEDFIQQISNGDDDMPAFKDKISQEDIKNLVRLVRKDFQGDR